MHNSERGGKKEQRWCERKTIYKKEPEKESREEKKWEDLYNIIYREDVR